MTWEMAVGMVWGLVVVGIAGWALVALLDWLAPGPEKRPPIRNHITEDEDEIDHRFY